MKRMPISFVLAAALAPLACASGGRTAGPVDRDVIGTAGSVGRDVIGREQLESVSYMTVYDAVRRFRPAWFRAGRGVESLAPAMQARREVRVYLDGAFYGGPEELKKLSVKNVEEIRYLDPRAATLRYGIDHPNGALLITTRS